jgi:N-acetylmuramoyl-L-alanine amidase
VQKPSPVFILLPLLLLMAYTPPHTPGFKVRTVVIDAGHGGHDPGCHGKNAQEAAVTLQVAIELGRIIKENLPDVKVIFTRQDNRFVELHERAAIANRNQADLFISLHCNSGPASVLGTETYTMGLHQTENNLEVAKRENGVILKEKNYSANYGGFDPNSPEGHIIFSLHQNAYLQSSLVIAQKIEEQFKTRLNRSSRGVKQAGLLVLWKTAMPAVLVELGFLTNATEEKYLTNKTNQVYLASAIYRAVKSYKLTIENP